MTQGLDLLAEQAPEKAAAVLPVFITVDPARDTVEALAGPAGHFHPRLMALTGTEEEVSVAAKSFRNYYQTVEEPGASNYLLAQSSVTDLLGQDRSYLSTSNHACTAEHIPKGLAPTRTTKR